MIKPIHNNLFEHFILCTVTTCRFQSPRESQLKLKIHAHIKKKINTNIKINMK